MENRASASMQQLAKDNYNKTKEKQKMFSEFKYAAKKWNNERRVIAKSEHTDKGANPRYIVTNDRYVAAPGHVNKWDCLCLSKF